ncbi:MAG: hypothetical protein J7K26_04150 [Candidatus Aenigmarchaeota archaeon]|nr:hypothetical protein [Candidatus Aenigmarchaeota archaeon]
MKEEIKGIFQRGDILTIQTKSGTYTFKDTDQIAQKAQVGYEIKVTPLNRGFDKFTLYDSLGNEIVSGKRLAPGTRI